MKTFLKRIIQLMAALFFCIQPLQAQTIPTVAFESFSSGHSETYSQYIPIKVVLSGPYSETVYVEYAVTGGTATGGGVDYILDPGQLTFSPGETTKDIIITMIHDLYGEENETIIIELGNPTNAALGSPSSHTYTIVNDDLNGFDFYESSSSGSESVTNVTLTVGYFTWLRVGDVTVNYEVTGGTATGGGVDYILDSGTLTLPLGQNSKDIEITVIDDSVTEEDETIIVKLTGGNPDSIGLRSTHTYTILNDDDEAGPSISDYYPEPNSIQVARNTYIMWEITDNLSGIDVNTVKILVEDEVVYKGSLAEPNGTYNSSIGTCRRIGSEMDYKFIFLPSIWFDYDQEVDILVYAQDTKGNSMPDTSYSFYTVMRSFGENLKVNSGRDSLDQDHPTAATDSSGNIWVVWDHTKSSIDTDIYIGKLAEGESSFGTSTVICNDAGIQNYPVIAIDSDDNLYVAWQGKSTTSSHWDIYVTKSADGTTWSEPVVVNFNDSSNDYDQTLPAIAIDHDSTDIIYIACENNSSGNQDIWISSSTNGTTWTPKRITTNTSAQTDPAIAVNKNHVVYVVWTDARNASTDFYGTTSEVSWANLLVVYTSSEQSGIAIAPDPVSGLLHEFWVDNANGYYDIFYRMEGSGSNGISVTDEAGVGKNTPAAGAAIIDGLPMTFVAWRDWRNVQNNSDTDIYYTEQTSSGFGTNILVNDDIGTSPQSSPAVGADLFGNPYIVWADQRNGNKDIYYAGVTSFGDPLSLEYGSFGSSIIIQAYEKVEVTIPLISVIPSGFNYLDISISRFINPPALPDGYFGVCYDFRPSGLTFNQAVQITITHNSDDCPNAQNYQAYWYNTETDTWSQEGISNVMHNVISTTLHSVTLDTTHFSSFIIATGSSVPSPGSDSESGSSGGCAMSQYSQSHEEILGYFLPYIVYVMILLSISWSYKRKRINKGS